MSTTTTTTTTTTTRDRGDRYGPMEWAQQINDHAGAFVVAYILTAQIEMPTTSGSRMKPSLQNRVSY